VAQIICPKCKHTFDSNNAESLVTRGAAAAAIGGAGAWLGADVGIVAGPLGAISGLVPCAIAGGLIGWFAADQFRRCPKCAHIFKT
jgi:hypothetical protein